MHASYILFALFSTGILVDGILPEALSYNSIPPTNSPVPGFSTLLTKREKVSYGLNIGLLCEIQMRFTAFCRLKLLSIVSGTTESVFINACRSLIFISHGSD